MSTTKFLEPNVIDRISRVASEAITVNRVVKVNASDHTQIDACDTGSTEAPLGVAEASGVAGDNIPVAVAGRLAVEAGGTIAAGNELTTDDAGKAVARGTTATVLYRCIGIAMTSAADGELVMVAWGPFVTVGANAS